MRRPETRKRKRNPDGKSHGPRRIGKRSSK